MKIVNNRNIAKELKDFDKTVALYKLGDTAMDKEEFKLALGYYTESLKYAYHQREEVSNQLLSDIYTQRSAVLMKMNKYASAIRDLNRALSFNNAEEKKCGLEQKKQVCTENLDNVFKNYQQIKNAGVRTLNVRSIPELYKGESNLTKSLSAAVKVNETTEKGRHIIALEDLPVGKLVIGIIQFLF